jgi:HSP20 family protein
MAIERWDPFREGVSLREAMNSLLADSFVRPTTAMAIAGTNSFPLDVSESDDEFVVHATLPGINPDEIQITVQGDVLTIRGDTKAQDERKDQNWLIRERRSGSFQRSITFGTQVDADRASTQFEHGVLTLTLPKSEQARPKQIKIGNGRAQQSSAGAKLNQPAVKQGSAT